MILKIVLATCFVACTISYAADYINPLNIVVEHDDQSAAPVELPDMASKTTPPKVSASEHTPIKTTDLDRMYFGTDRTFSEQQKRCKYFSKALCCLAYWVPGSIMGGVFAGVALTHGDPGSVALGMFVGGMVNTFGALLCNSCCTLNDCCWYSERPYSDY